MSQPLNGNKKKRQISRDRLVPKNVEFFSDDEENRDSLSNDPYSIKQRSKALLKVRETLPVYKSKGKIMENLLANRVTVLIGETGSGKSTQIPQFLIKHNQKAIAVTQPRRVAAMNLASRVAEEYGTKLGDRVGYTVRFDNRTHAKTKLRYLTDGMLLRELMVNRDLSQYSCVIIDEAHERTILSDLLMGFLKTLLLKRKDLQVIVMSATIDAEKFSGFFNNCPIIYVEGKMYPVERMYLSNDSDDVIDAVIKTIIQINQYEEQGDILAFLPGQEEIDKVNFTLNRFSQLLPKDAPQIVALPLYAALPPVEQLKVFQPIRKRQRKVVLSTNIAETSVTVPGVRYVVDSGLRKVKIWRHLLGLSTLLTVPISQASATQRAGRAGRERPGKVFRLYTEQAYLELPKQSEPEIIRSEVSHSILMLKKLDVDDLLNWNWLESPGKDLILSSLSLLHSLRALDDNGKITKLGEQMSVLPVSPSLATVLISLANMPCLEPVIDIVACLSVENLILNPSTEVRDEVNEKRKQLTTLGVKYGDLLMLKEIFDYYLEIGSVGERKKWCKEMYFNYRGFKNVVLIRDQLRQYMKTLCGYELDAENEFKQGLDIEGILKNFLKGFIKNTAIGYPDRSYRTVFSGQNISIHPSSLLFGQKCDGIMYTEFVYTTKGFARNVSLIDPDWLEEVAPHVLGARQAVA